MVPVGMTFSDNPDFKITIIQRHNSKMVQQLYLQWPTNRKSYINIPYGAIFNDPERSLTAVSRSRHSLKVDISETVRDADIVSMKY